MKYPPAPARRAFPFGIRERDKVESLICNKIKSGNATPTVTPRTDTALLYIETSNETRRRNVPSPCSSTDYCTLSPIRYIRYLKEPRQPNRTWMHPSECLLPYANTGSKLQVRSHRDTTPLPS